ncbi:MAG: hypothetical protein IEMM0002_0605 [bacterium]|nr:MAG: hypothetical protein IEMM0002_0605 [bacterium]
MFWDYNVLMGTMSRKKFEPFSTTGNIDKKAVGKRIKRIRGNGSYSAFGKKIGVAHTTIMRYEKGMLPSPDKLLGITKHYGCDLHWLLTGKTASENQPPQPPQHLPEDEYVSVPLTEGKIAAGEPIITRENVIDWVVVHVRPLKRSLSAASDLVACRVSGDSMWPQISDGDIVVINRGVDKRKILKNKVYAVWVDGGITAKMLQKEGYRLFLIPFNPAHKISTIDLRINPAPIVGIVIGVWKDF